MPRKHIGRKPRAILKKWNAENMIKAITALREKSMGLRRAVKAFKVPQTTLQRFVHSDMSPEDCVSLKVGRKPVLPDNIEKQLVEYLVEMDNRFYGLTRLDVKRMAYQLAQRNNIQHPFSSNAAGRAWFDLFIRRHKNKITIHKPIGTSFSRANGFNKEAIDKFFDMLQTEYDKHSFSADRVYNVDETGLTVVQSKIPHVVGLKGKRQVGAITAAERGSLVTVVCCMSAGGTFIPPMMIFPRKNWTDTLMKGAPPGAIGKCHPSGWIQTELFTEWFEHFVTKAHPTKESPVLLVLDGHNSHARNIEVIERARKNHVTIVSIPPHTSHKTQPLDKTFMGTLKTYYSEYVRQWMRHSDRPLGPYDISELFGKAYLQCQTGSIAAKGFSETGIFPCDRTVFGESDFIADTPFLPTQSIETPLSSDEDRSPRASGRNSGPDGNPVLPNVNQITTTPAIEHLPSKPAKKMPREKEVQSSFRPNVKSGPSEIDLREAGCSKSLANTSSNICVSPQDIMPVPPPKRKSSNRGRKPGSSAVFTSSPYKTHLEESLSKGKQMQKLPLATNKTSKKSKAVPTKTCKKRLKFEESDEESNASTISSGESNLDLPVGEEKPTEEDAICIFCGNSFSKDVRGELWIKCLMCEEWSHSLCAGCESDTYICDFCK